MLMGLSFIWSLTERFLHGDIGNPRSSNGDLKAIFELLIKMPVDSEETKHRQK